MDVREKLVEERVELADIISYAMRDWDDYIDECRETETPPIDSFEDYIADGIISAGYRKQEWISVKDRLPALHTDDYKEPDGNRVQFEVSDDQWVITASGDQTVARYETGVVFQGWVGEHGETVKNVTHWMHLPDPPKDHHKHFPTGDCK